MKLIYRLAISLVLLSVPVVAKGQGCSWPTGYDTTAPVGTRDVA